MCLAQRRARRSWVVRPTDLGEDNTAWDDAVQWMGEDGEWVINMAEYDDAIEKTLLDCWRDTFWLQSQPAGTQHVDRVWEQIDRLAMIGGFLTMDGYTGYLDYITRQVDEYNKVNRYFI